MEDLIQKFKKFLKTSISNINNLNNKNNKNNKNLILKSSAISSLIGVVLVGFGMSLGGASSFYVGSNKNILGVSTINFIDFNNADSQEIIVKEENIKDLYSLDTLDAIDTLSIDCSSVNNIQITKANQFALIYDTAEVDYKLHENTIEIKNNANYNYTSHIGIFNSYTNHYNKSNIKVYIPDNIKYIKINSIGELDISDITTEEITIKSDIGDVLLDNIHTHNLDINTNMSNININYSSFNNINCGSNIGNLNLNKIDIYQKAYFNTDLGNIKLNLNGSESDYNYYYNIKLGSLAINDSTNNYMSNSASNTINNNAMTDINLVASMGSIKIYTK